MYSDFRANVKFLTKPLQHIEALHFILFLFCFFTQIPNLMTAVVVSTVASGVKRTTVVQAIFLWSDL